MPCDAARTFRIGKSVNAAPACAAYDSALRVRFSSNLYS